MYHVGLTNDTTAMIEGEDGKVIKWSLKTGNKLNGRTENCKVWGGRGMWGEEKAAMPGGIRGRRKHCTGV